MLSNLRLVLLQNKRFLSIFLLVVFLPSLVLAAFGIRAIRNERYKLQQLNLEQQRVFIRSLKAEVQSLLDREVSVLRELASSPAMIDRDGRSFHELISRRVQGGALSGMIVIFRESVPPWFPGFTAFPPRPGNPTIPEEWTRLGPALAEAERAEFRLRDFDAAISYYGRILQRATDNRIKAWIRSRIARCEVKRNRFEQAVAAYRSIIEEFPEAITESGRPLSLACRTEILDVLRAEGDFRGFFLEALQTLRHLDEGFWSFGGDHVDFHASRIADLINESLEDSTKAPPPPDFRSFCDEIQESLDRKLGTWRLAEMGWITILGAAGNWQDHRAGRGSVAYRSALELDEKESLFLALPLGGEESGYPKKFIGSLLDIADLRASLDAFTSDNHPPGVSVVFRSTRSDGVLHGEEAVAARSPAVSEYFPENFPPWKIEIYQDRGTGGEAPLTGNIFFWTILALLLIVLSGSGLIIRTLVREASLLNLKSEFIASVSHEFKTPLTAMGAILERLLSQEVRDPGKLREYHQILSHDSDRLKRLVKNVLDFTKIEDGKREYRLAKTDLAQLVRQEVGIFEREQGPSGFSIVFEVEENLPPVMADEEALGQALHNVLDNAAKFSGPARNIDVEISRGTGNVEISVRDRGVGIPESERKKVFEKFFRGRQASSVSPTGTGLGLTLVRHIMDGHGGDVLIQSHPGKGTRVTLILPVGKEER